MGVSSAVFNFSTVMLLLSFIDIDNAFNLSTKPNIVLRVPETSSFGRPKTRSSYFGFSLNLKRNSVLVGAPRAQSTLESQKGINETGAVYKCVLDKESDQSCKPFVFDSFGNNHEENKEFTFNKEKKDYQWLGASMDGGPDDDDKFVVCAPRLMSDQSQFSHYLMHGICYWTTNTSSDSPMDVQKIAPLRLRAKQQYKMSDKEVYFHYIYGEQGLSVHITENNGEILIGAPGIFGWKGSVISYKPKPLIDLDGLSRREAKRKSFPRKSESSFDVEYSSDVPNPLHWNEHFDDYFGFAVSSGYFDGTQKTKLLYVASAPHANLQQGAVYIFDIVDHYSASDKTIKIYHTFSGQQFGEYFGYSLLTEDFDNDGLTDVAIGAPYNSKAGTHENGAVYIYKNEGTSSNFVLHTILRTNYEFSGRFGTTISKVGDINQDGFNDLIVAAPFEQNGAIYIYHGSVNGLPTKATQRIAAPQGSFLSNQMFGHGLSKGADIDANQYLDIAVGSPETEMVYIYKSYPVVRINASITPFSQEIQTNDKSFKFSVCWLYETAHQIDFVIKFNATVKLDGQLGRALFKDRTNEFDIYGKITANEQCIVLEAFVTFSLADIFRPIELEMTHNILNGIPKDDSDNSGTQDFCNTCVAINPNESKNVKNKIVFSTGCENARCIADLRVTSSLKGVPSLPYILGSSSSLAVAFEIENIGETAYLARIRFTLPETGVLFTKTPSNCKLDYTAPSLNIMECDLNGGLPLFKGTKTYIMISVDTGRLEGEELVIKADVFSAGDEQNESDNTIQSIIPLAEFSNIEVIGNSMKKHLKLLEGAEPVNLTHTFEIRNYGPSNIKSLDILLSLPISHINPITLQREQIVDINSISVKSVYSGQYYEVEWSQNGTILLLETVDVSLEQSPKGESTIDGSVVNRSRRSVEDPHNFYFNQYLQRLVESDGLPSMEGSSARWGDTLLEDESDEELLDLNNRLLSNLPSNRTIYFDCKKSEEEHCLQGRLKVTNLKTDNGPILITLNITIDLGNVAKIVSEKKDIFVVRTSIEVSKSGSEDSSSISVVQNQPFTIISKTFITTTPLWIYILSIVVGILSLTLISYALYRFGFFKRGTRDNLVQLKRQSQLQSYWVVPGDGEDSE